MATSQGKVSRLSLLTLILLQGALAGCSIQQFRYNPPGMDSSAAGELFPRTEMGLAAYANHLNDADASAISNELKLARQHYQQDKSGYNTLRLAVVLMQPQNGTAGSQQAENMLNSYLKSRAQRSGLAALTSSDEGYQTLAQLLLDQLTQRHRLLEENLSLKEKINQLMYIESTLSKPQASTLY